MATRTSTAYSSPLLAGLDQAIAAVESEARALQAQQAAQGGYGQAARGAPGAAPPAPAAPPLTGPAAPAPGAVADGQGRTLEDLTVFLSRLKQMKDWLQSDERLLPIVDEYIGQRVKAMEKHTNAVNTRLAVITTVAGALLGWLTSLAQSPSALLHAFFH